jgi:hypothetical protein
MMLIGPLMIEHRLIEKAITKLLHEAYAEMVSSIKTGNEVAL